MSKPGQFMEEELKSQPYTWSQALDMVEQRKLLPSRGKRVAVVGCGTSYFIAQSYAALREMSGYGETDAYTGTEVKTSRDYDAYVVISRSGTTTEIFDLLKKVKKDRPSTLTVALIGDMESPAPTLADRTVDLHFADEKSVVQTRFATTALMFLRSSIQDETVLRKAVEQARDVLSQEPDSILVNAEQYSFLGRNWVTGLATEAALKMRESSQVWTESYNSMEYRHGPIAIAEEGRVTWIFDQAPDGLTEQVQRTGATFVEDASIDPIVHLVKLHQVALATSRERRLNAD